MKPNRLERVGGGNYVQKSSISVLSLDCLSEVLLQVVRCNPTQCFAELQRAALVCREWYGCVNTSGWVWREALELRMGRFAVGPRAKQTLREGAGTWRGAALACVYKDKAWQKGAVTVRTLHGHRSTVNCLQLDDNILVSGCRDHTARIWDIASRDRGRLAFLHARCVKVLRGHQSAVSCLQYDSTCNRLVTGSWDRTARIWNLSEPLTPVVLSGHTDWVLALRVHGNSCITGAADSTARVWDLVSGACVHVLEGHTRHVKAVEWDHETAVAATAGDETIRVWDPVSGQCLKTVFSHTEPVNCLQLEDGARKVASGSRDCTVQLHDLRRPNPCIRTFHGHRGSIGCLVMDGTRLYSGSNDTTVRVWDIGTGTCEQTFCGHSGYVHQLCCEGQMLVSGSWDDTCRVWDLRNGNCRQGLSKYGDGVRSLLVDGRKVVAGSWDGPIHLWEPRQQDTHNPSNSCPLH